MRPRTLLWILVLFIHPQMWMLLKLACNKHFQRCHAKRRYFPVKTIIALSWKTLSRSHPVILQQRTSKTHDCTATKTQLFRTLWLVCNKSLYNQCHCSFFPTRISNKDFYAFHNYGNNVPINIWKQRITLRSSMRVWLHTILHCCIISVQLYACASCVELLYHPKLTLWFHAVKLGCNLTCTCLHRIWVGRRLMTSPPSPFRFVIPKHHTLFLEQPDSRYFLGKLMSLPYTSNGLLSCIISFTVCDIVETHCGNQTKGNIRGSQQKKVCAQCTNTDDQNQADQRSHA